MMKFQLDPGYYVSGPPWRCSCGQDLEPAEIDRHLLSHLVDRAAELAPPHTCPPATMADVLGNWWRRFRAWLSRAQ